MWIDVRLATGGAINPFRDDWTCGILLGTGDWPGYDLEPLFSAELFPVCAPAIARRPKRPADLTKETLLQVTHSLEDWRLWCAAARLKARSMSPGPKFDNYGMAIQAAVDGAGVAIGLRPYVEDDIAAGRLVAPFDLAVPKGKAWFLVYRPFRASDPSIVAFRDWLRASFPLNDGMAPPPSHD